MTGRAHHPRRPVWAALACLGAAFVTPSCTTQQQLAAQLEQATQQRHLPKVASCWERAFERMGFRGEFEALLNFTVEGGTGQLRDVELIELEVVGDDDPTADDPKAANRLGRCIVRALERTSLASGGMSPTADLRVTGFRMALTDGSADARRAAADRSAYMLIGPRTDRCDGLFSHEPPRKAAVLHAELAEAQGRAQQLDRSEGDAYARALQKTYDLALELVERLERDARDDEIPVESRERTNDEIERILQIARDTGARIGCRAPARL